MHLTQTLRSLPGAALLLLLAAIPALADWPSTNLTKWVQYPDPRKTGYDVLAAQIPGTLPLMIADDFPCRKTGPITDIHIWASWLTDNPDPTIPITLSIWSDVPAVTNADGSVIPSHPTNMLWSQIFGPGQYTVRPWQTADEQFWNPGPWPKGQILGPDHMIWQYNFYPAKPFVQQGSPTNPIVYWLSVTAGANTAMFGWKTSTNHWNDDAVVGHLDPNGIPKLDWQELRDPLSAAGRSLDMSFAITTAENPPPPPPTNKWLQLPDVKTGLDVKATFRNIVADDFPCKVAGTITNIQIWSSWWDAPDPNTTFVLSIWSDQPATTASPFSHPATLLWTETFAPGGYLGPQQAGTGSEQFYDPDTGQLFPEQQIWRYSFTPKKPFCQKGSTNSPVVYWLSVMAKTANPGLLFGWKTSTNHWNDDAVYGHVNAAGAALGDWKDLHDPRTGMNGISLDMAFLINNGPPTADCDVHQAPPPKWVQWPNTNQDGLDVRATVPKILADDFQCKRPGRINGIRVWGSWLNDKVAPTANFTLGLWSDVKAITNADGNIIPSHPGQLLCWEKFYPPAATDSALPRYKFGLAVSNVQEQFYDPNLTPGLIGADTQIWRYDFYPTRPCWKQYGLPQKPVVYWLSVMADGFDTNQFLFGWKTSTNHWNDDGVFGHVSASGGPLNDWKELRDPRTGISLDLSFALRSFPIVSLNKDLINKTTVTADGVQIVIAGVHEITRHYDDMPAPFPNFDVTYDSGNTILTWSGKPVPPNALIHVGAEMAGTAVNILSMKWLLGREVIGIPIQLNVRMMGNGSVAVLANDLVPGIVTASSGSIEYYPDPVPLELMKPSMNRNPLQTYALPVDQGNHLQPGGVMRIPLPQAPPEARYALLVLNLMDESGAPATMDFLLLAFDTEMTPIVHTFQPSGRAGSFFDLRFSATPGRIYRIRESPTLPSSRMGFFDVFTEVFTDPMDPDNTGMMIPIPTGQAQSFFDVFMELE